MPTLAATPPTTRWRVRTTPLPADADVARACGIAPVTATILRARGLETIAQVQRFLTPSIEELHDPMLLPDIEAAVERLHQAITGKEPILVFGDYDVDGITSTAMVTRLLRALGAVVTARIPERHHGYGLTPGVVEAAKREGFRVIFTADNGIRATEAAERADELGIDLIITDHHEPGDDMPEALAVINPKRYDSEYPFQELCGCGVAFKVMLALLQQHWPKNVDSFVERFVDLVAIATIADCVPLHGENRVLAHLGLRRLERTNKPGLQALMRSAGIEVDSTLSGRHVSFRLAPRLNAAGRVAEAVIGLNLLLSTDATECEALAIDIEGHNRTRQESTTRLVEEALQKVRDTIDLDSEPVIVLAGDGWPHGLVGLVASRLVESYARPVIMLTVENGVARGSGRSIDNFDLGWLLEATEDLLISGGGHKAACGLSLEAARFEEFRARVRDCAGQFLEIGELIPTVTADCTVPGRDITPQLVGDLAKLEPCGNSNGEPLLMLSGARIAGSRTMGQGGEHLKWSLEADGSTLEAVWWRAGDKAKEFATGQQVDVAFVPDLNHWNGSTRLQLIVRGVWAHNPV